MKESVPYTTVFGKEFPTYQHPTGQLYMPMSVAVDAGLVYLAEGKVLSKKEQDDLQMHEFEIYLKCHAYQFLMSNHYFLPEHNGIVEKLIKNFMETSKNFQHRDVTKSHSVSDRLRKPLTDNSGNAEAQDFDSNEQGARQNNQRNQGNAGYQKNNQGGQRNQQPNRNFQQGNNQRFQNRNSDQNQSVPDDAQSNSSFGESKPRQNNRNNQSQNNSFDDSFNNSNNSFGENNRPQRYNNQGNRSQSSLDNSGSQNGSFNDNRQRYPNRNSQGNFKNSSDNQQQRRPNFSPQGNASFDDNKSQNNSFNNDNRQRNQNRNSNQQNFNNDDSQRNQNRNSNQRFDGNNSSNTENQNNSFNDNGQRNQNRNSNQRFDGNTNDSFNDGQKSFDNRQRAQNRNPNQQNFGDNTNSRNFNQQQQNRSQGSFNESGNKNFNQNRNSNRSEQESDGHDTQNQGQFSTAESTQSNKFAGRSNQQNENNMNAGNQMSQQRNVSNSIEKSSNFGTLEGPFFLNSYLEEDFDMVSFAYAGGSISPSKHLVPILPLKLVNDIDTLSNITKPQKPKAYARYGEVVGVCHEEPNITRAVVIGFADNGYKLFLVDYGIILTNSVVYDMPEKFTTKRIFTIVCHCESDRLKDFSEECTAQWKGGSNEVQVTLPDDRQVTVKATHYEFPKWVVPGPIFEDGEVKLVHISNDMLVVRNKASFELFQKLNAALREQITSTNYLTTPPEVNQLVVFQTENKQLRGYVTKIIGNKYAIYNPDLHRTFTNIPLNVIYTATEKICSIPQTGLPVKLNGLESFTEIEYGVLNKYLEEKTVLLVEKLPGIDEATVKVSETREDIKKAFEKAKLGFKTVEDFEVPNVEVNGNYKTLNLYSEAPYLYICSLSDTSIAETTDKINDFSISADFPKGPYKPSVSEVVLAQDISDEQWYRAEVLEILPNASYNIHFIDFGNNLTVKAENLRKLPENIFDPIVCMKCELAASQQGMLSSLLSTLDVKVLERKGRNHYVVEILNQSD